MIRYCGELNSIGCVTILFDPKKENTISVKNSHHKCDYAAFEGFKTKGEPVGVMSRGDWLLKDGKITATKGRGKFIKRARFTANSEMVR